MWGTNDAAKPEYATAQIAVWWNMRDCPIPEGYNARRVRPSMEGEFKKLGYFGPVSITAFGDHKQTPDHLLQGLTSTGVAVAHTIPERMQSRIFADMVHWGRHNPPPATIMLISNHVEEGFSHVLVQRQQEKKYNLFLAYSFRPYKMSILVTSAEWLWDTLLAETRRQGLHKCSERGESTIIFHCKSCFCDCKDLVDFRKHLSSKEHAQIEARKYSCMQFAQRQREESIKEQNFPKSKRLRKAPRVSSIS